MHNYKKKKEAVEISTSEVQNSVLEAVQFVSSDFLHLSEEQK